MNAVRFQHLLILMNRHGEMDECYAMPLTDQDVKDTQSSSKLIQLEVFVPSNANRGRFICFCKEIQNRRYEIKCSQIFSTIDTIGIVTSIYNSSSVNNYKNIKITAFSFIYCIFDYVNSKYLLSFR